MKNVKEQNKVINKELERNEKAASSIIRAGGWFSKLWLRSSLLKAITKSQQLQIFCRC